ncbi:MAG: flagellar filament protein FlaA [Treponema sp.]|nr:flagellar filament protein FlaA [Treponema sp.]
MKKGVTIIGSLILAFAVCVPAFSQPNSKAVETIVIDNFDTDQEWDWDVQTSRFIADGFPLIKKFEGMPNSLKAYHDKDEPGKVLGVKVKYNRKGDNWFEVFPKQGEGNYEIPFRGTVTQIDFWVWGANYNYNLEVLIRDADGRVHTIKAGNLAFQGWRNIVINVPGYIRQHSRLRSGRPDMTFVGFRIRSDADEAVDDYIIYFDQLKYTTNFLSTIYDGYELRNMDFGEGDSSGKSSGSSAGSAK